jgi:hypothetical protein
MIAVYGAWCVWEIALVAVGRKKWVVFAAFQRTWHSRPA